MNQDYTSEREPLDTKGMLEEGFFAKLGKNIKPTQAKTEVHNEATSEVVNKYNTEKLLLSLFEARDGLVDTYSKIGVNTYSQNLIDNINKIGSCIRDLGGEVDSFDPFVHMSGLHAPNIHKNAKRVIENTVEAYSLGKINDANISKDGKTISLTFSGQNGNVDYKAVGTLAANKSWTGNEAIDYVYTFNSGRMSVKSPSDDGKWIDKSANYKISWELFENEVDLNVMPIEGENGSIKEEGNNKDNAEIKEEVKNISMNNISDKEIGDFPIEEKE